MTAILALIAFLGYFAGMVALHVLPTGFRPLYNTVSDYSRGRFGPLARAMTALNVLGTLGLLAALRGSVASPPLAGSGLTAMGVLAICRLGMVFLLTDESGTKASPGGLIHALLAVVSFAAAIFAVTTITQDLEALPAWHGVMPILAPLSSMSFPLVIALLLTLTPGLRRVFGLMERIFLADVNLWLLIAAGALALH